MEPAVLLTFWGLAAALIVVPGPDWAYTLASGLRDRSVVPAVSGILLGYVLLTVVVAVGVGAAVRQSPVVLTVITVLGAGYLVYLGAVLVSSPAASPAADQPGTASATAATRLLRGIGVSGLNPKGVLMFVALLPQFTDPSADWPMPVQVAVLGLVFIGSCAAFYSVLGVSTRTILSARPSASRAVSRFSGGAMMVVGVALLVERL